MGGSRVGRGARFRSLTILDMMVLVVAFGLAFQALRDRAAQVFVGDPPTVWRTVATIQAVANWILMPLTVALAIILVRPPRPPLRRLLRRPGPAACLAAGVGIVVMAVRVALKVRAMLDDTDPPDYVLRIFWFWLVSDFVRIDFAVLGAWVTLLLTVGWRRERSSVGWACQALGWAWVLLACFHLFVPWLQPLLPPT